MAFRRPFQTAAVALTVAALVGCGQIGSSLRGVSKAPTGLAAQSVSEDVLFDRVNRAPTVVQYQSQKQLQKIADLGVDFEGFDLATKRFRAVLDRPQFESLSKMGVKITQGMGGGVTEFDPKYHTYEETKADLQSLARKYGALAEVVDIGDAWEKTQKTGDRDILALHIGKKGAGKPVVLFAGAHHARELVTPEMVLNMAHHLLDGYGKDAEATAMVETRDIWLVPMVNPDGHAHAVAGEDQRKNTNTVTGGKRRIGVDLNRNYGAPGWSQIGSSNNPESDTFCGKAAFSEPEVQAMRDLMRRIKPTYLLTFHSYSNVVLWPWGYTEDAPPDARLALVGNKLGQLSGYKAGQSSTALYATAGDDTDFAFSELGTLAYTVEVGGWDDGFDPPYSKVAKFWDENRPMMMFALRTADNPAAAKGPDIQAVGRLPAAKAVAVESFMDRPGQSGTGGAATRAADGKKHLVWTHGRDAQGNWGPWTITWSK